jgi:hypothetical protein
MGSHSVSLPLDVDNFLRRECPHCRQQFKWHNGSTSDQPEGEVIPSVYHCPLCGDSAPPDEWWTEEQIDFIQGSTAGPALREASDELKNMLGGIKGLTYRPGHHDEPEPPAALHEPNDMVIVASPCHTWEPVKVPEGSTAQMYCLICGEPFTV